MPYSVLGLFSVITLTLAIHDAFELYGRPKLYSWDPRDSASMMFAYPIGPEKQVRSKYCSAAATLD
jgi:CCR4-NOT transcriptional complex subunit CAF120